MSYMCNRINDHVIISKICKIVEVNGNYEYNRRHFETHFVGACEKSP